MLNVRSGGRHVKATKDVFGYNRESRQKRKLRKAYKEAKKEIKRMQAEQIERFLKGEIS